MIRPIVHDPFFLAQKSEQADEGDRQVIVDLLDTLRANLDRGAEADHRLLQRPHADGDGESGDHSQVRHLRGGGGLPFPGRDQKDCEISKDYREVPGSAFPGADRRV